MMTSGEVLREARERKGYELATVARRLRIRPDILRAIEDGDFNSMPPKGYARNMVNAYARLLGLNATDIVNMYLDEVYAHQVEKARGRAPQSGFVMEPESRRSRSRAGRDSSRTGSFGYATRDEDPYGSGRQMTSAGSTGRMTRHLYDDRTQYSRDDYGAPRDNVTNNTSRDFRSHHSGYSSGSYNYINDRSRSRRGERTIHVGQTPMEYKPSRLPNVFQSRLAIGIAIAAVIILILVLVFFVFGKGGQPKDDNVQTLPVSGINDTTGDDESSSAPVEIAPTSARIIYSVAEGYECYIETYADNTITFADTVTGPKEMSAETSTTWKIVTPSPDGLKVTVNGEEVKLTTDDSNPGIYTYTVDFAKILDDWNKTHGSSASTRQAAVASAQNAATEEKSAEAAAQAKAQQEAQAAQQQAAAEESNSEN